MARNDIARPEPPSFSVRAARVPSWNGGQAVPGIHIRPSGQMMSFLLSAQCAMETKQGVTEVNSQAVRSDAHLRKGVTGICDSPTTLGDRSCS